MHTDSPHLILSVVAAAPGSDLAAIGRLTGLPPTLVDRDVQRLTGEGLLELHHGFGRPRVFPAGYPRRQRIWAAATTERDVRLVFASVLAKGPIGLHAIAQDTGLTTRAVRRRLIALEAAGLVQRGGHYRPRFHPTPAAGEWAAVMVAPV
jgi:DNA-binding IclR family transcriptional regulator